MAASTKKPRELRAFLVGASPAQTVEHVRETLARFHANPARDLFIGVDGGTRLWLRAGFKPHLSVGDWDSFKGPEARKELARLHHLTLPVDKDRSDLFFAAAAAANAEATQLICLGVTGGRPDHHLASLLDLSALADGQGGGDFNRVAAYSPEGEYHFLSSRCPRWRDSFPEPQTVSVFAVSGRAKGLTLKGFKFPLSKAELEPSSQGLSNRAWARTCEVSVERGGVVVMVPTEKLLPMAAHRKV